MNLQRNSTMTRLPSRLHVRSATPEDAPHIAALALLAGEGIPAWFWRQEAAPGEALIEVGARRAARDQGNFSYRNAKVARARGTIAGMLLGYRLDDSVTEIDLGALPDFVRPLVELEQQVPGSWYVNMLAVYERFQGRGIGRALLGEVDGLARAADCDYSSIQVFEGNRGAVRLYQSLGYEIVDSRPVVPHEIVPHIGRVLLLTRRCAAD